MRTGASGRTRKPIWSRARPRSDSGITAADGAALEPYASRDRDPLNPGVANRLPREPAINRDSTISRGADATARKPVTGRAPATSEGADVTARKPRTGRALTPSESGAAPSPRKPNMERADSTPLPVAGPTPRKPKPKRGRPPSNPGGAVLYARKPSPARAVSPSSPAGARRKTQHATVPSRPPGLELLMEQARHRTRLIESRCKVERAALSYPQRYLVEIGEQERGARGSKAEAALEKAAKGLLAKIAKGQGPERLAAFVAPYLAAIAELNRGQKEAEKLIVSAAEDGALGPLADFIEGIYGLNVLGTAGVLAATGWPGDYRKVSGIWKRLGLGVFEGKRQQNRRGQNKGRGFAPWRRGAVYRGFLAVKMRGGSEAKGYQNDYAPIYDIRKAMTADRLDYEGEPWTKAHRHADALGVMFKELLRDMAAACGCQDRKARKPSYRGKP